MREFLATGAVLGFIAAICTGWYKLAQQFGFDSYITWFSGAVVCYILFFVIQGSGKKA